MLTITFSLTALPVANAQDPPIMNLPGPEGEPHYILYQDGVEGVVIDLNGGPGPGINMSLFIKYPGRTEFTYIWSDLIADRYGGDLDYYDFDFNETGDYECKWAMPPDFTIESNVEIARVVLKLPPSYATTLIYVTAQPLGAVGEEMFIIFGLSLCRQTSVRKWVPSQAPAEELAGTTFHTQSLILME